MTHNPLDDAVSHQYQRWVYPEPIDDLPGWLDGNWQWFDPSHAHAMFWPDRPYRPDIDVLVAGCGANQAAVLAFTNPQARVVGIDVSQASLDHHEWLKRTYSLGNLDLRRMPIEEAGGIGHEFDLIVSTGVLHHMADPDAGAAALAGCLARDGVLALMLYAHYGRIGVQMMQGVFRDMGLRQDEPSLEVVKRTLAQLPPDHPVQPYMAMAPDLAFDAGLVDTFLHGRDRSYTVDDCLALVRSAGLSFIDWFLKSPYYPLPAHDDPVATALAGLPVERQWTVMERMNPRNACHFFTACRTDRPEAAYRIDFGSPRFTEYVPSLRYRCELRGSDISRPGWSTPLDAAQIALAGLMDGRMTIGEIIGVTGAAEAYARELFQSLWQLDFIAVGVPRGRTLPVPSLA